MSELERLRALQSAVEAWAASPHTPRWRADHELLRALASYHLSGRPQTRVERAHAGICVDEEGG